MCLRWIDPGIDAFAGPADEATSGTGAQHLGTDLEIDDVEGAERLPIVIVGCGMSGLLAAIRLREAGFPVVVIEKKQGPGGTWYENTYPGARVDVGNHFYAYSFEPADEWSEYFSRQPELLDYFERTMRKHGISQMPVTEPSGAAYGMIHEYDLLNALISGSSKLTDTIDSIVAPMQGVVTPDAPLQKLREVFAQDNVAVVRDGQKVVGIVTKIDLIEHLASRV